MSSTRPNSSSRVLRSHRSQRWRNVSSGDLARAAWPAFVSASFEPLGSASFAACSSIGQANALMGPITCSQRFSFFMLGS